MNTDLQIARSLTWRYLIALTLVGLLATAAWLSLHLVISEQKSTAAVVNISGRQRMLSQRTALFSSLLANLPREQRPSIRSQLTVAAELMQKSHQGLTRGNAEMGLPGTMSETVRAMYFEPPLALDEQVSTYLTNVQALLKVPDDELGPDHPLLQSIIAAAPVRLVTSLDKMVSQYQLEGEASVSRLHKAETLVWLVTLLLLAIEAAFIFRPFTRQIRIVIDKLQGVTERLRQSQDELEERVRQRTADLEKKTRELADSKEKLQLAASVFANSYDGVLITDAQNIVIDVNPGVTRITGYTREEIIGQSPKLLASDRQSASFYADMWASLRTQDAWQGEIWNRRKNGEVYAERLAISVVRDNEGHLKHYIGVFTDISQIKEHEAELDRIAHYDSLTGVPNRRLLADRLDQAITHARRSNKSLAVCYLDLDGFKPINDQFGHAAGDELLITITLRLKEVLRAEDTLARLGGDEFVLICTDLSQSEEIHIVLDRVLAAVSSPILIEDASVSVSASIGVTLYPGDDADPDTLLRHADQAMYLAKDAGKNRYQLFDPERDRQVQTHRGQQQRLQDALTNGEFVMYYQPKVDLLSGEVVGAEALIRWQHPEQGLLSPGEFLRYLYGTPLEISVGEWVIAVVLKQISLWKAAGLSLTVSANISADHLLQTSFAERLRVALEEHPELDPEHLELEILETAALADMDQAIATITRCHQLGVRFALDDFGTGYSSLSYFRSLPVDILKIDQSFVRNMLADPEDLGMVESVVRLACAFNRPVIAEGVETLEHGAMLIHLGCRLAQGYGIARPMPADQMPAWVAQWRSNAAWVNIDKLITRREDMALQVAKQSHTHWLNRIAAYLDHPGQDLSETLDSLHCRFGRWYRGSGAARYGEFAEFQSIAPLHEFVHIIATGIVALARDGQIDSARENLPELYRASDQLLAQIEALIQRLAAAALDKT